MGAIVSAIIGILSGSAGEKIGGTVARAAELAAIVAAVTPIAIWIAGNKDETFIVVSYGDLAFWGLVVGSLVFVIVRLVHRAPPPQ